MKIKLYPLEQLRIQIGVAPLTVIARMCTLPVCFLRDADEWHCTLIQGSQRVNPSWLSLLIAPSYYLSVKTGGGGPASLRPKTIHLH